MKTSRACPWGLLLALVFAGTLAPATRLQADGPDTFVETNGLVVMEGEHFAVSSSGAFGHAWQARTNQAGYVGDMAMQALPNAGSNITANIQTTSPAMTYFIQFATPGTYNLWLRVWAASSSDDSVHLGLNGQVLHTLNYSSTGAWVWRSKQVVVPMAARYEIHVWMREDGAYVDRLLLTTNLTFTPTGDGPAESARTVSALQVRTNYRALVLYYNPHVWKDGQLLTVTEAYNNRNVDVLCSDYITFLKRASGGQVNWSVAARFELDEFPPETNPDVTFTPENYDQYRSAGYDISRNGTADYLAICSDARFQIVPKVEAGEVDAVWVFAPEMTGFWETAMAGRDSYWVNGQAYPEVNCSKRFVIYGFGMSAHQGVGFMLENTAHMTENILNNRIASGWPPTHEVTGWTTLNLTNPSRQPVTRQLNDWLYFILSDSASWDVRHVAPRHSQAGLSHYPPTAFNNYGWSALRFEFNSIGETNWNQTDGGTWSVADGKYYVQGGGHNRALFFSSDRQQDNLGEYRVPVTVTDADIETGIIADSDTPAARAGVLLRWNGDAAAAAYYVALNPGADCIELVRSSGTYEVLAQHPMTIDVGVTYPLFISLRGPTIRVSLSPSSPPVITFTNATDLTDGGIGFSTFDTSASFTHLHLTPVIANEAENWRAYPNVGHTTRTLTPLEWRGDGDPYQDNDFWFAWWYEHLPKNPGTHEVRDPAGAVLGKALNSWWPYIFDVNTFDTPFLPNVNVVPAPADTSLPGVPQNLQGIGDGATSTRIEWDEPEDNVGVTRYEVYRDDQLLSETPLPYFTDSTLTPNTSYSYFVKARDGSGNVSEASGAIVVTTLAGDGGLQNGSFEVGLTGPIRWRKDAFNPNAAFVWENSSVGRNGTRCVSINAGAQFNDARWLQDVAGLVPNGRYLLKGWIKGENIVLGPGATEGANLCVYGTWEHAPARLVGTFDWTPVQMLVVADTEGKLTVGCRLGYWGSVANGKAWFDDLSLDYVANPTGPTLHASTTGTNLNTVLSFASWPGWGYRLLTSTNLQRWDIVTTFDGTGSPLQFTHTNVKGDPQRFWRLELQAGSFAR